jgi:hypothetical protein
MKAGATLHVVPVTVACPVTTGTSVSCVHEIVWTNGALWLPQASTNIHVFVCVEVQFAVVTTDSTGYPATIVGVPQLSLATGSTNEGAILHVVPVINAVPVTVGISVSFGQVIV